ncbi:MAG: DUF11 domain-containing protein [Bacteroidetes bacterium]|nr:DUF11 domain-containing protein [Bacteroidota bacterium]
MSLNDADWTASGNTATMNSVIASLPKGGTTTVDITLRVNNSYQGATLTNVAEISSSTNALGLSDIDSPEDNDPNNDAGGAPNSPADNAINGDGTGTPGGTNATTDEDNADPAQINVTQTYDLALTKVLSSAGPFVPGSDVTFTLTVYNQGTLDASNIQITDYIPTGMSLNDADWTASGNTATMNSVIASLPKGGTTTVDITLRVNNSYQGATLTNVAEISSSTNALGLSDIDSPEDNDPNNDAGGAPNSPADNAINGDGTGTPGGTNATTDEDNADPAQINVTQTYDLALTKVLSSAGPFVPGSDVTFTLTVYNQGTLDASNIQITDYIPTGMSLNDADWTASGNTATMNSVIASLPKGGTTTVDITLRVNNSYQGATLTNVAEISSSTNALGLSDIDSPEDNDPNNDAGGAPNSPADNAINGDGTGTPGGTNATTDEDNADPAQINVTQTYDLALTKQLNGTGPFYPGANVTFTLTVYNQGTLDASNIQITDYIPTGMTLNDPDWNVTGSKATLNSPIASLPKGATTTVDITLSINSNFTGNSLVNYAEISGSTNALGLTDIDSPTDDNPGNDAGGNPNSGSDDSINGDGSGNPGDSDPNTDEDDHDPAQIDICYMVLSFTNVDVDCFGNSTGNASVSVSFGFAPYAYLWSNGVTTSNNANIVSGTYIVTVTDSKGCTETGTVQVSQPNAQLVATCSGTPVSCKNGNDGSSSVTATGGTSPYSYAWSNGASTSSNNNVPAGTYTATVTDANGCTATCSFTVTEPTQLVATCSGTPVSCKNGNDGSSSVTATGGTSPYSYAWSNGASTSSNNNVPAGTYTATVTDANGCTATCSFTVTEPTQLVATCSGTPVSCKNGNDGSSSVTATGGTSPYSYAWSNGASTSSNNNVPAGTYTATVTDANGCTATCSFTVTEPTQLVATCSGTPVSCKNGNDGSSSVTATGGTSPYSYAWSNGASTSSNNNVPAGTYTATVTDANGCTATCSFTVTEPTQLVATCSGTPVSCKNGNDGSSSVTATGGTSPYSYAWSNGASTSSNNNVPAGTYTATVTDANGCTATCSFTVTEPTQLVATCSGTPVSCKNGNDGSSSVTATGGTSPQLCMEQRSQHVIKQ